MCDVGWSVTPAGAVRTRPVPDRESQHPLRIAQVTPPTGRRCLGRQTAGSGEQGAICGRWPGQCPCSGHDPLRDSVLLRVAPPGPGGSNDDGRAPQAVAGQVHTDPVVVAALHTLIVRSQCRTPQAHPRRFRFPAAWRAGTGPTSQQRVATRRMPGRQVLTPRAAPRPAVVPSDSSGRGGSCRTKGR